MNALFVLFSTFCMAYIPKATTIIQRTTENSGSGVYTIEQEVQFPSPQESFALKEYWTVENDSRLKLVVTGTKELKDKIHWVFIYDNDTRTQIVGQNKLTKAMTADFIEKYFHFRTADRFQNTLVQLRIVPASFFINKPLKVGKEVESQQDPHLRLARVGGVITYAIGTAAESAASASANFFIEQDQFVIRKFRLPSQVEVSADSYSIFARGLNFPRTRTVRWGDRQVTIQTIHVQPRFEKTASISVEPSTSNDLPELGATKAMIEEFYKRFR